MAASELNAQPRRTTIPFYSLWALFWLLMVVVSIQGHLYNPATRWWQPILWEGSSMLAATAWVIHRRYIIWRYRQYLDRPITWMLQQLKWMPVLAVVFVVLVYAFRHGVYALMGASYQHEPWAFVFVSEILKLTVFLGLWLGVLFAFDSFELWQQQREHLFATQKALAEAQLSHLKAQLQPHFLFNALNTISSLMHTNVEQADQLLTRVGDLLRASLQANDHNLSPLRDELRLLELYAQIMQERFGDRLTLIWSIDSEVKNALVPSFLLQPLLENAFKHGVEPSSRKETVRIAATGVGNQLQVSIHNTGSTLAVVSSTGIGLSNCRERLRVLYGGRASLELTDTPGGVQVSITLPYSEQLA
jgi:sensor histidine kinase YesM